MESFTTGQLSKMLNISVRTLRYYDQIGLIEPSMRDHSGRRLYTEADLLLLEKAVLLKSIALPLDQIKILLTELNTAEIVLKHKHHLEAQLEELSDQLKKTTGLLTISEVEDGLSWERVLPLARSAHEQTCHWKDSFNDEQIEAMSFLPKAEQEDDITKQWISILKRTRLLLHKEISPDSEEGHLLAQDITRLSDLTFRGDAELMEKFWDVRKQDPDGKTGLYPVEEEVLHYIDILLEKNKKGDMSHL
ncbi:MerR family transcriptional regulator [Metabacillus idriensis]|uniref:MerR family transcriptional regulator n=1 Tax=Metabacillus idriensis TaxID=324768 RepID=UPI003D2C9544